MFCRRLFLLVFSVLLCQVLLAQLCQGSLGEPLVNITFGAGSNPGPPLNAAATTYRYTAADCPNDGFYTVRNRSDRCYGTWNSLTVDHTGDPNGYFMLVNASYDPGDFYVDTVELACSNTTYEFAAWVTNMNTPNECNGNPIRPNLTFVIAGTDGTQLQSFNTGDLPPQNTAAWRQFGFFFNLPPLVNRVVVKIRNNAPGGCGNDLALDDITFRPCGPKLTAAAAGGNLNVSLCQGVGQSVTLTGTISQGFDNPFLQWQRSNDNGRTWTSIAGANEPTLTENFPATAPAGTVLYRLTAARVENRTILACRVNSDPVTVTINQSPTITAATVAPLCEGSTLRLRATGGATYSWTSSGGFTASGETVVVDKVPLSRKGWYYVTGTDAAGCRGTDSIDVTILPAPKAILNGTVYSICEGEAVQLEAAGGDRYRWSPTAGLNSPSIANPVATPSDSTRYSVLVSNTEGCTDSASVAVNVYKQPTADAGPVREIGLGQNILLAATATGSNVLYAWSPAVAMDDATKLQPRVAPAADQVYILTVTSAAGCGVAIDSVRVIVYKGIYIPTAFTPNGDGKNDVWRIFGLSIYPSYEILVFNRWGGVVYRSKQATAAWDGTLNGRPLPAGSYPYLVRVVGEKRVWKGLLTLIR